jgi:hypothetical protein
MAGTTQWSFRPGLAASQSGGALSLVEPQHRNSLGFANCRDDQPQHDSPHHAQRIGWPQRHGGREGAAPGWGTSPTALPILGLARHAQPRPILYTSWVSKMSVARMTALALPSSCTRPGRAFFGAFSRPFRRGFRQFLVVRTRTPCEHTGHRVAKVALRSRHNVLYSARSRRTIFSQGVRKGQAAAEPRPVGAFASLPKSGVSKHPHPSA